MSNNPFSAPEIRKPVVAKPQEPQPPAANHHVQPVQPQMVAQVPQQVVEKVELLEDSSLPAFTMEEETCRTCRFYAYKQDIKRLNAFNGECRRYAPRPTVGAQSEWPVVGWESWCGEWETGVSDEDMVQMARAIGENIEEEAF